MADLTSDSNRDLFQNDPLYRRLNDAGHSIPYRPILRRLTNDINAAILLQQIIFNFIRKDREKFYKFEKPSEAGHPLYREGDSLTEELGFTEDELKATLKVIATRVKSGEIETVLSDTKAIFGPSPDKRCKKQTVMLNCAHLVVYWRQADNVLRFVLNERLLLDALSVVSQQPKVDIPLQQNGSSAVSGENSPLVDGKLPSTYNIDDCIDNYRENNREVTENVTAQICHDGREAIHLRSPKVLLGDDDSIAETPRTDIYPEPVSEPYSDLERFIAQTVQLKTPLSPRYRSRLRKAVTWTPEDCEVEQVGLCPNALWDTDRLFQEWVEDNLLEYLDEKDMLTVSNLVKQISSGKQYTNFFRWREWQDDEEFEYEYEEEENRQERMARLAAEAEGSIQAGLCPPDLARRLEEIHRWREGDVSNAPRANNM